MESEFPQVRLGNICKLRSGYPFKSADWTERGEPVIKIANVKSGRILPEGCAFVSSSVARQAGEWYTQPGDILIAMTGYVGELAWVRSGERYLINQRVGRFEKINHSKVIPRYLFYALQHPEIRGLIETIARGSAQPNLSAGDAHGIEVPLPPLQSQQQIGETLSVLDDKIAILRESNATLEAIAQAIFKSWFVDFDPVRAKAAGRDPEGVPSEVAELFPTEFEDSELGAIPKGWHVAAFQDLTEVLGGSTPSTKEPMFWEEGEHFWATPKDLSGMDTPVLLETERKITDAGLDKISSGLLPVGTVLLSSRAPIGYLAIAEVPVAVNQGFIAMKARRGVSNIFLLRMVQARMEEIKSRANGSTFLEISKGAFRPIPVVSVQAPLRGPDAVG